MDHIVTIFKDVMSTDMPHYVNVEKVLKRIENSTYFELIESIQEEEDKEKRNEMKKKLPAICFSGKFSKRSDKAMIEHSGLICLDFDNFKNDEAMYDYRDFLQTDPYTYAVFISPSGNGLKVLVKIPRDYEKHRQYFNALEQYYDVSEFDTSCKNESRVCYESSDPEIFINKDSKEWTDVFETEMEIIEPKLNDEEPAATFIVEEDQKKIDYLMKWWNKNYGFVDGQWDNYLHILACALCTYGVDEQTSFNHIKQIANEAGSMPDRRIHNLNRSAYSRTEFGTKQFEDTKKVSAYAQKLKKGASKKELKGELVKEGLSLDEADKVYKRIEDKAQEKVQVFWSKSDKGAISMNHILFKQFLSDNGFYKNYPDGGDNFIMVRRVSNLIENTLEPQVKDFTLDYLENLQDYSIYNYFAEKTKYFKYDFLSIMESIDIDPPKDTKDVAHLFYRNCVVILKKDGIETVEYDDFDHWVWADHVINRDFSISDSDCDFKTFVSDVASDDKDRIESIESTIGYLLHSYRDPSYCPAVILNDEVISDNPDGGTGKGIFVTAVSHMKNTAILDGKAFDPNKSFPYQTVKTDTQLISFDDVKIGFDFERLFSIVTEGITLEYKNKTAIKIPKERSPKVIITTNYAIAGEGNSHERRKWELEFSQFYHTIKPLQRFGRYLFDQWDDAEWLAFDNYMIKCVQLYLAKGLVESKFVNLKQRQFHAATHKDFADWALDSDNSYTSKSDVPVHLNDMFIDFTTNNPDFGRMKRATFTKWIFKFGEYKYGAKPVKKRDAMGYYVVFKRKEVKQNKIKL